MRKDNSGVSNYGKTRKRIGLRRRVNKAARRAARREMRDG